MQIVPRRQSANLRVSVLDAHSYVSLQVQYSPEHNNSHSVLAQTDDTRGNSNETFSCPICPPTF